MRRVQMPSVTRMPTDEMTTDSVVETPTFAPPSDRKPRQHATVEIRMAKMKGLIIPTRMFFGVRYRNTPE